MYYIFAEDQLWALDMVKSSPVLRSKKWKYVRSDEDAPLLMDVGRVVLARGWQRNPAYGPALKKFLRAVQSMNDHGARVVALVEWQKIQGTTGGPGGSGATGG